MRHARWIPYLGVFAVLFGLGPMAWGQEEDGSALGVARVSLTNGDVSMRRGDSGDWIEAEVNLPLVEGDSLATGRASRAEMQLDDSNLVRLNEETQVNVAELANRRFRVQVERGIVTYSELRGGEADMDIETPLVAVRPRERGLYRVEVFDESRVIVTVRQGKAEIASTQGIETLDQGRTMIVRADADQGVEFQNVSAGPKDDWDRFNERRDDQLRKSESYRYLSRSIYGAEDLDHHGHWVHVPSYGYSWFPSVAVGWAPYRHGRWVWVDYYGWTWVGREPWGWAPYHYGRWFHHAHYGWGWYPGPRYSRHHWRPALVSFFGYGSHSGFNIGIGIGFGNIGWVPLAPGERFYPWYGNRFRGYRGGGRRNTTIIVDNSVNIYNNFRNARHRHGVTVVETSHFGRGNNARRFSPEESNLRRASLMRGQVPVVPDRDSQGRLARAGTRAGDAPRNRNADRRSTFFSRAGASQRSNRTPFEQQRQDISTSIRSFGQPGGQSETASRSEAGRSGARPASQVRSPSLSSGSARASGPAAGTSSGGASRDAVGASPARRAGDGAESRGSPNTARTDSSSPSARQGGFPRVTTSPRDQAPSGSRATDSVGRVSRPDASRARTAPSRATGSSGVQRLQSSPAEGPGVATRESSSGWRRFGSARGSTQTGSSSQVVPRSSSRIDTGGSRASSSPDRTSSRGLERSQPRQGSSASQTSVFAPRSSSRVRESGGSDRSTRVPAGSSSRNGAVRSAPSRDSSSGSVFAPRTSSRTASQRGSQSGVSRSAGSSRPSGISRPSVSRTPSRTPSAGRASAPSTRGSGGSVSRSSGRASSSGGGRAARSSSGGSARSSGGGSRSGGRR